MAMVDRFTSIIDAFDDVTVGLSLDQVAARAELPRSTTHRILDHLVRLNWLSQSGRRYSLGARAMSWGAGHAADLRLRQAAAPVLHDLQHSTNSVVHLGVFDGHAIVHVDKLGGPTATRIPTRVGTRIAASHTALGLAVLAAQPPDEVDIELSAELHRIRRTGVAQCAGDYLPGFTSLAAALDKRAAVGIVVSEHVPPDRYRPLLLAAAARIRRHLNELPA